MDKKFGGWEFSVKETESGVTFEFKGDPEKVQASREAVQAFREFRKKATAAGMAPGSILRSAILGLLTSESEKEKD